MNDVLETAENDSVIKCDASVDKAMKERKRDT